MDVQPHPHFCGRKPAVVHVLSDSVSLTSPGSSPMHHKGILLQPIAPQLMPVSQPPTSADLHWEYTS